MHCRLQDVCCAATCSPIIVKQVQTAAVCPGLALLVQGPTSLAKPMPTPRKRRPAISMPMFCASACSSAPMRKAMPPVTMMPRRPRPPRGRLRLERRSTTIPAHTRSNSFSSVISQGSDRACVDVDHNWDEQAIPRRTQQRGESCSLRSQGRQWGFAVGASERRGRVRAYLRRRRPRTWKTSTASGGGR